MVVVEVVVVVVVAAVVVVAVVVDVELGWLTTLALVSATLLLEALLLLMSQEVPYQHASIELLHTPSTQETHFDSASALDPPQKPGS